MSEHDDVSINPLQLMTTLCSVGINPARLPLPPENSSSKPDTVIDKWAPDKRGEGGHMPETELSHKKRLTHSKGF